MKTELQSEINFLLIIIRTLRKTNELTMCIPKHGNKFRTKDHASLLKLPENVINFEL